jgi:hypothetical protein
MRSNNTMDFRKSPSVNVQRSRINLDETYTTTFDCDKIYPCYRKLLYPGDQFKIDTTAVLKLLSPLGKPVMDNLHLDFHWFAVPLRLLWDNWPAFMGDKEPSDDTEYSIPQLTTPGASSYPVGSLWDYFGLPTDVTHLTVSALPFRAYNLIYNDWYRDQNLQDKIPCPTDDGPDSYTYYEPRTRNKFHDYFTGALPWPQKGDAPQLPFGDAPVIGDGTCIEFCDEYAGDPFTYTIRGDSSTNSVKFSYDGGGTSLPSYDGDIDYPHNGQRFGLSQDPDISGVIADLSAIGPTINEFRYLYAVQEMMERDARYGTRLNERIYAHFGVTVPDFRVQRPEYIGGGSTMITPRMLMQTSQSDTTEQGNMSGHIDQAGKSHASYAATEECYIIGLFNIRADLTYQHGIERDWKYENREEFFDPIFANLGERPIYNYEIFAQGTSAGTADDQTFGYQEAWAEMKFGFNKLTGLLRSTHATSLDVWHFAEEFGSLPVLNESFMASNVPIERTQNVTTEHDFIIDMYHQVDAIRPVPMFANPQIGSRL